jgi:4-hydroxy-3-polyprenylbenzoate decarboxylase
VNVASPIQSKPIAISVTGASGFPYTLKVLECLLAAGEVVHLVFSEAAHAVIKYETDLDWPARPDLVQQAIVAHFQCTPEQVRVFGRKDWLAPMASGSNPPKAMLVCPCTMGTLSAIAQGHSDSLITRAADVMLKEQKKLIIVPREMPYSAIHLENMLKLARLGVVICDANPAFYYRPKTLDDLVDFVAARILDHLGVPHQLVKPWGAEA